MNSRTIHVLNLTTGQPFEFDVPEKKLNQFEHFKQRQSSSDGPDSKAVRKLTEEFEAGLFPSHEEVRGIFLHNGYTDELVAKILFDFGVLLDEAVLIIRNERFHRTVYPCFKGIAHDSGRATRALRHVYNSALYYKKQLKLHAELLD